MDIYRVGYYQGDGARLITSVSPNVSASESQPACNTNTTIGLVDCGNWGVSATWAVPATAVSGVYFARIYSSSDANQIPFVVTNNASTSDIIYSTSDETWQAYNDWGGFNLYSGHSTGSPWCCSAGSAGRAVQVSYNRPFATRSDHSSAYLFWAEFPMIEWMEENGYDVTYVSQPDLSGSGGAALLEQHKIFMMSGHSEYIDSGDRASMTAARNAGVDLAFFSGNLMWWKTRWAASQYGNEAYRTLITYKESVDTTQSDPADPPTWTGNWRDPRFVSSGDDSGQPENALTGQLWMVNCCQYADQVPSQYGQDLIWKNTAVASLASGQTYTMPAETLGEEWDSDLDNGLRPAGEIDMSKTCENVSQMLLTATSQVGPGHACNSLTLYRAASGALVFAVGTFQWSWGLSSGNHDGANNGTNAAMQQATVNLFAMMNVQPATLMSGLVAGVTPHDTAPPTSTITAPAAGAAIANGSTVTVSGTAADSGGGVVAGVEVSTDGGSTWHPATTMSAAATSVQWTYQWSAAGNGPVTILSRATDDDANAEIPGPGVPVTLSCPCGLFGTNYVPTTTASTDTTTYELGVKFESTVSGWVAGVRFYKGAGNNGIHTGSLWSASGALLASGTFEGESASGWQTLYFASPVQISANTVYVASYFDPDGHYAAEPDRLDTQLNTPPLLAPAANYLTVGGGNGVYFAGGANFPTQMFEGSNYAVDVVFDTTQPPPPPAAAVGVEGSDGALWVQAPQLAAGWQSLGGVITAPPAVVAQPNPSGTTPAPPLFIATGSNKQLWIRSVTDGWQPIGAAQCIGGPAAVITGTTLTVACRGTDNALWYNTATMPSSGLPAFTGPWTGLGGTLSAGPAVAPVGNTLTFFVRGASGGIYTRTLTTGYAVTPWSCAGQPAAALQAATGTTTFACNAGGALWQSANSGSGWSPAVSLGGALVGGPAVAATSLQTEFLAEGTDHAVWERTSSGAWVSFGGSAVGGVGAAALN